MSGLRLLTAFLGIAAAGGAQADGLMVAEFRADQGLEAASDAEPGRAAARQPDRRFERDLYYPDNLYTEEVRGSETQSWSLGDYTLSGVMDWGHRASYWAGRRYSDEQFVSLGSKFSFGENDETYLYYGLDRDRLAPASRYLGGFGDGETARTGLSQTLSFADQQAQVGVGYEYATGNRERLYEDLEGHEVNVSGRLQLGWGFNAHLEAGYGLYSYSEYEGVRGDLNSARTNMRAGISRSFTPSLSWGLHYSYMDEEFDVSELSQSRRSWGLNLEYRY